VTDRARVKEDLYRSLGWGCYNIDWLEEEQIDVVNEQRRLSLAGLRKIARFSFEGLKPHHGKLSPGCHACMEGTWSCLFINYTCNASCFWCLRDPEVRKDQAPTAHGIDFHSPEEYAGFLKRSGYKAVGFSGGEPFLAYDKLRRFVQVLRRELGPDVWLWVYTNGSLLTPEKVRNLTNDGLNEVRVDIAAHDYDLEVLRAARPEVEVLTVEIPCLPEDAERLTTLLTDLDKIGVDHLNLHQLTANALNIQGYAGRGYTFLHEPPLTVLQSEQLALQLVKLAAINDLRLGVQYCSKPYKKAAQGRSRRLRALQMYGGPAADVSLTATGYVRTILVSGDKKTIGEVGQRIRSAGVSESLWKRIGHGETFSVSPSLLQHLLPLGLSTELHYGEPRFAHSTGKRTSNGTLETIHSTSEIRRVSSYVDLSTDELEWLSSLDQSGRGSATAPPQRLIRWESHPGWDEIY